MTYAYVLMREECTHDDWNPYAEELHGVYSSVNGAVRAMRDDDTPDVCGYFLYRCVLDDPEGELCFVGTYDKNGTMH